MAEVDPAAARKGEPEEPGPVAETGRRPSRFVVIASGLFLAAALITVASALAGGWGNWRALDTEAGGVAWRPHVGWLALALGCGVSALLLSGAIWTALFRSTGGRLNLVEGTAAWLGSNLGRYLPGKVWQVTGLAAYVRARGDSGATALASLLSFQAIMLATGAAVGVGALGRSAFAAAGPWTLVLAALAIVAALNPAVLRFAVRIGQRLLREDEAGSEVPLGAWKLLLTGAGGLAVWALHGAGFWALIHGLVDGAAVGLVPATGVFASGYVLGYLVLIAPGGLFVREGAIVGLLGAAAGIPVGPAAAVALAGRLWSTASEVVAFGLAAGLGLRRRPVDR